MVNRNSSTPMYMQLENILEDAIKSGDYKDGDKLPSESDLCLKYSVSRITVRQALSLLEQKDLVYTVPGKGTFVNKLVINQCLLKVVNFGKTLLQKGLDGHTEIQSFTLNASNILAEKMLDTANSGSICNLNLVGYARKIPIVYYQSFFHEKTGLKLYECAIEMEMEKSAFSTYDLYSRIGMSINNIDQKIMATNANRELSKLFNIPMGSALLVLESQLYSSGCTPLEYKIGYYRSDKYAFSLKRELV